VFELGTIIFLAFLLDLFLGDPRYRLHPIRLVGKSISFFEKVLRGLGWDGKGGGILLVVITEGAALIGYLALRCVLSRVHVYLGLAFDVFISYSCLALKDLIQHIKPVIHALEKNDLLQAKKEIAQVVGRDVRCLDKEGVSRAGVETLAENFVDGFLSPLFWFVGGALLGVLLGLPPVIAGVGFMLVFKVGSTLDSMVGYKNSAFLDFGWGGARLDDLMNFMPARLSLLILFFGACVAGRHPLDGLSAAIRDRLKHDSPNAAHSESFVAGALRVRLGGPTMYAEGMKDKPWLGEEHPDPGPTHVQRAVLLIEYSAWISMVAAQSVILLLG